MQILQGKSQVVLVHTIKSGHGSSLSYKLVNVVACFCRMSLLYLGHFSSSTHRQGCHIAESDNGMAT